MKRKRLKYWLVEWNHSHREKKKPRVCPLPVLRAEGGGSRWPDARWACSGMVYGLRAKQKKPKRGGSVSMFLSNLPKFPHGRPDSDFFFFFFKTELLIPSGALPEVVWRESSSKSGCKSRGLTLSHRETPVGYMILYISARPLSSGASPSLRISSALTHRKTSSSLSSVVSLLHNVQHVCQNIHNTKFYFARSF